MELDRNVKKLEKSKMMLSQFESRLKQYLKPENENLKPSFSVKNLNGISNYAHNLKTASFEPIENSNNFFTSARKQKELKNRIKKFKDKENKEVDQFQNFKEKVYIVNEEEKFSNLNPYPNPYYSYLTKQLANEALVYENRKVEYMEILRQQRQEIEFLKNQLVEKNQRKMFKESGKNVNNTKTLKEKLEELKLNYRKIRDTSSTNQILINGLRNNRIGSNGLRTGRLMFGSSSALIDSKTGGKSHNESKVSKRKNGKKNKSKISSKRNESVKGDDKKKTKKRKFKKKGKGFKRSKTKITEESVNPILKLIQAYNY